MSGMRLFLFGPILVLIAACLHNDPPITTSQNAVASNVNSEKTVGTVDCDKPYSFKVVENLNRKSDAGTLVPEDLDETIKLEIQHVLSQTIHVGARPLTAGQWRALLDAASFNVRAEMFRPMRLLKPNRLIQDEGLWGAVRFAWNLWRDEEARRRVKAMHQIFMKYRQHLAAIMLVGIKRPDRRSRRHDPKEDVGGKDGRSDPADRLEMSWRRAGFS